MKELFISSWSGHNFNLGLRAETEDVWLSADLCSLVAPPKGGPADIELACVMHAAQDV